MSRPKGSKNKMDEEVTPLENVTVEELKKEKSTETKKPEDFSKDLCYDDTAIEKLNGIGPKTAEKLRDLGYVTVTDIATARADEISSMMKVTFSIAKGWTLQAQEALLGKMDFKTAEEQDKVKKSTQLLIFTGSSNFNGMLGGGVPTKSITGLSGRLSSGKTQICFDCIVDCLGRLHEKAVFIETEPDTFHLDRLKEIARTRGITCNWSDLYVQEAENSPTPKAQFLQYKVVQRYLERGEKIRLVVVDSMTAKFRGWSRSELLPIRTREFAEHFGLMEVLAAKYNLAWLLTFQVIAPPRPDQGLAMQVKFEDNFYPVGGDYVLHSVNNWVALIQKRKELWEANLFDSSHVKRNSCEFMLTAKGLMNAIT